MWSDAFRCVAIAMQQKVALKCSLPRPCVLACMCISLQQIAFGSRHQKNVQTGAVVPTRIDSTLCACVRVRV